MNNEEIERTLRQAPAPRPPNGLRARLHSDLPQRRFASRSEVRGGSASWFTRWLPALSLAGCLIASLTVLGFQRVEISRLQQENTQLRDPPNRELDRLRAENREYRRLLQESERLPGLRRDQTELERLREEIRRLRAQTEEAARLQSQIEQARATAAMTSTNNPADDFFARNGTPKAKAQAVSCVNNLKQIALASRIYAVDNGDVLPASFVAMKNELGTPAILTCPADETKAKARSWSEFTGASVTYELLTTGGSTTTLEPHRVLARCPIHGTVALVDGSVQQNPKTEFKDGKWMLSR